MKPFKVPVYRIQLLKTADFTINRPSLDSEIDLCRFLAEYLEGVDREHLVAVAVDARFRVIGVNTVAIGSLRHVSYGMADLFKMAILLNASGLTVGNNHPSGDPSPTQDDLDQFRKFREAGRLLGITVHDSLVIGEKKGYSIFKNCMIDFS